MKKYEQIAYDEAKRSRCIERQVGAVLVNKTGQVLGQGHNSSPTCSCDDPALTCPQDVVHAEMACLANVGVDADTLIGTKLTMYITQPPCNSCLKGIESFEIIYECQITIHICEQFLKFDADKIRFDLVPPEWEEYDAKVLTYGAKRYKPNNWRNGEIERYKGACMRHWSAYRKGEWLDPETGLPHLAHLRTNIGFLITLEEEIQDD